MHRHKDGSEDERGLLHESWADPQDSKWKDVQAWRIWIVSIICLVSGFALGTLFNNTSKASTLDTQSEGAPVSVASLFPPNISVVFEHNDTFTLDPETDGIWEKLMPVGRGFIQIDAHGNAIPHIASPSNLAQTKVVSVFHQLHCLDMLRKSLSASVANSIEFSYMVPQLKTHWRHCFDYLRQALMCSADVTLENLEKSAQDNRLLASVDGWGTEHMCRDWRGVFEWAERNRATDDDGID